MALITFLNSERLTVATRKTVFEPGEIDSLTSVLDQAERLQTLYNEEEKRIEDAAASGHDAGFEEGQGKGYEAALQHIAVKLVVLTKEANATRASLEHDTANLAIKIVERIASELGPQKTIAALAKTAASDLVQKEPIVLRVHPANLAYMKEEVVDTESPYARIVEVLADTTLSEDDCVLETEFGQINAGLQTQLSVLREKLYASH
jgi:flagellar biosynthesis/type III secretory pathway protein FliH